jgi:hypothetical protein
MVQKERRRANPQIASFTRSDDRAHVVYHAHHAISPVRAAKGVMTLARVVSNQSVKRRLMPLACQEGIESQPDKELFCHLSSNISFFLIFFFLLQGGSRVEVKNLVWSSDKVTTILGNASGDRIHICTLVGHAQLFHDFGESVNPTRLLFFGLPGSVASAKVSKQLRIYTLVHLCQLHVTRSMRSDGSVMDWRRVRERTG